MSGHHTIATQVVTTSLVNTSEQERMREEGEERAYNSAYRSCPHVPKIRLFLEHPAFEFSRLMWPNAHALRLCTMQIRTQDVLKIVESLAREHRIFTIQRFVDRLRDWSRVESYSCINYWPQHLSANLCKSVENTDFDSLTMVRIYRVHTPCAHATCHRTRWTLVSRHCDLYHPILTGFVCMDMQKPYGQP